MIVGRKSERQIPIDFLRLLYNKSLYLSIIVLVNGHGQIGKSTVIHYLANRLKQIQKGIPFKKATWNEWDWKRFNSQDPRQFVQLWDENENEVLALEEAGEQMNYLEWYGIMSRVFSSTTNTQGLKKNICFLVTPRSKDITKHNRENVDFRVWVRRRDDIRRTAGVRPRYVRIDYLKDKYRLGWIRDYNIKYSKRSLREAKRFTDHLKTYKSKISAKNKEMVGIYNPHSPISDRNKPEWINKLL
ncbi:unnamed protein product [marine sediment metagenome]|uniref:Uncharacterized protein n=1 Tax=marine sediment metagenome TaxID=412755 RepID=X1BIJ9_9ZZZZ